MKNVTAPWQAITGNPLRFLGSPWPWRALAYLLTSLPGGGAVVVVAAFGRQTALVIAMIMLLVVAVVLGGPIASLERWRLRLIDPAGVPAPKPRTPISFANPTAWREIGYALLWATVLPAVNGLVITLAALTVISYASALPSSGSPLVVLPTIVVVLVGLAGCAYLFTVMAAAQGALARGLLAAPPEERMIELTRSRARLVDAFEAERRRIERDLHDGAQHQLTAVLMQLGLAQLDVREDPERTAKAISLACDHTQAALDELRRVIRGIHPSALTGRGLGVAVTDLARHCPIPVTLDLDLPHRPPPGVEAAAYFCISESLTNVIKHSNARKIMIKAKLLDHHLALEVRDDGIGGADAAAGSGITGLADRVGVLEGTLSLSSPPGGPTVIRVELPCG
ncbi:histidine kinase [Streptosporangium sp. CA-135522]|uniref:sensor histidine kinase n=1 Tax=Streptosporangium sp. CA-135522 TaxID=3240072 RepID=UPI003D949F3C